MTVTVKKGKKKSEAAQLASFMEACDALRVLNFDGVTLSGEKADTYVVRPSYTVHRVNVVGEIAESDNFFHEQKTYWHKQLGMPEATFYRYRDAKQFAKEAMQKEDQRALAMKEKREAYMALKKQVSG